MYTIGGILEQSAEKHPGREALVDIKRNLRWDYKTWDEEVNRLANALTKMGVYKGDRVSVYLANTVEFATAFFAAARLGAVFNPINRHLSPSELHFILNDAESKVLIFGGPERARVERAYPKINTVQRYICTDEDAPDFCLSYWRLTGGFSARRPDTRVHENDWLSVIYTSGTTGKPKGVIHRHRDILDHSMCMAHSQQLTCHDRGLAVAPLYHAAELHCFFIPRVHAGAANILLETFSPDKVLNALRNQEITVMFADPPTWGEILQTVSNHCFLPHFRLLASGGAPMPPPLAARCKEIFKTDIIQYYGMSEMGPAVAVLYPGEQEKKAGSAGQALLNHRIRVVRLRTNLPSDPEDELPPGQKGEVVIRGAGMMQGYYNRPELTAEALYGGWHHSGDIGYFDGDGFLWITDRLDDAIISGVENIYPREIEKVLLECPGIQEVAVVGLNNQWKKEIVAFIVTRHSVTPSEIDSFLRRSDRLADYKFPVRYQFVNYLPKSSSCKVQKYLLVEKYKEKGG